MITYEKRAIGRRLWNLCRSVALILLLVVFGSGEVLALSDAQKKLYEQGIYAFDLEVSCSPNSPLNKGDRYQTAWSFFTTTTGLSMEATAGIMGNLEAESGIDPHNMQNTAPLPDGPEMPTEASPNGLVPHSAIRGKYGYGIAQWTSAGRQQNLIDFAKENNKSTGDFMLQLDFLWKELNQSYTGVMAALQTPGVTVEDASFVFLSEFEIPLPFTPAGTPQQRAATTAARLARSQAIYETYRGQSGGGPGLASLSGCGVGGPIDLESTDTTHIQCTNGTEDAGPADGYRDGKLIKLRLCKVGGALVNSQLAGAVQQMLNDSAAVTEPEPVPLGINGSFRTMEGQINMYYSWCRRGGITPTPPPYPRPRNEYTKCPGAAPPGYSNHQQGLALDLECNGSVITRYYPQAKDDPCFKWLLKNGINYHLYEWGKGEERSAAGYEAWHWSVDGG